jgi:hypothetical protein
MRNREQFGMAGLGGLGTTASGDIAATLQRARAARTAQGLDDQQRAAAVRAQEELAKDPSTAALLALVNEPAPVRPVAAAPARAPIPKGAVIVGGLLAVGLVVLIAKQWRRR